MPTIVGMQTACAGLFQQAGNTAEHCIGTQNWAQLKNNYGAVWDGSIASAPPLDLQVTSNGQTLVLR